MLELDAAGDPAVRRVLSDAGRTVGRALADLANSLNPELVVVGGSLGPSASLIDGIRASIDRYAQPDTAAVVRVVAGELGDRAEVVGAVALAIARVARQLAVYDPAPRSQSRSSSHDGLRVLVRPARHPRLEHPVGGDHATWRRARTPPSPRPRSCRRRSPGRAPCARARRDPAVTPPLAAPSSTSTTSS